MINTCHFYLHLNIITVTGAFDTARLTSSGLVHILQKENSTDNFTEITSLFIDKTGEDTLKFVMLSRHYLLLLYREDGWTSLIGVLVRAGTGTIF